MYAVVDKRQLVPAKRDQVLNDQTVPMVKRAPGFITAYWGRAVDRARERQFALCDNHATAERFTTVVTTDREGRGRYGVETPDWFRIIEIEEPAQRRMIPATGLEPAQWRTRVTHRPANGAERSTFTEVLS